MTTDNAMHSPDTKPGPYFVSATDAGTYWLMAGPYADHAAALADIDRARDVACFHDGRAKFMSWGTIRAQESAMIGALNQAGLLS